MDAAQRSQSGGGDDVYDETVQILDELSALVKDHKEAKFHDKKEIGEKESLLVQQGAALREKGMSTLGTLGKRSKPGDSPVLSQITNVNPIFSQTANELQGIQVSLEFRNFWSAKVTWMRSELRWKTSAWNSKCENGRQRGKKTKRKLLCLINC